MLNRDLEKDFNLFSQNTNKLDDLSTGDRLLLKQDIPSYIDYMSNSKLTKNAKGFKMKDFYQVS